MAKRRCAILTQVALTVACGSILGLLLGWLQYRAHAQLRSDMSARIDDIRDLVRGYKDITRTVTSD